MTNDANPTQDIQLAVIATDIALTKALPAPTLDNMVNSIPMNAESSCDTCAPFSPLKQASNLTHIFKSKFMIPLLLTDRATENTPQFSVRVKRILSISHIFQICNAIVSSISVFVVHVLSGRTRSMKGSHDKSMDVEHHDFAVERQTNLQVAHRTPDGFQDAIGSDILNPPQIANDIVSFISRYWSKFFLHTTIILKAGSHG
jgi:hypothetical protein